MNDRRSTERTFIMLKNSVTTYPTLLNEELIPIQKSGERFPHPVGRKAIERYFRHGLRGVRLETVLIGNRRFSSVEAIERFLRATNKLPIGSEEMQQMTERELRSAKNQAGIR